MEIYFKCQIELECFHLTGAFIVYFEPEISTSLNTQSEEF